MRPYEETEPPDPLRGFRTFVLLVAGGVFLVFIGWMVFAGLTTSEGDSWGAITWVLATALLPFWGYHRVVRSPSGSFVLGLLILAPAVALPLVFLGVDSAALTFILFTWVVGPFWLVFLLGLATEIILLYPGYEARWRARRRRASTLG